MKKYNYHLSKKITRTRPSSHDFMGCGTDRIILLYSGHAISGRDLILIGGGLFLLAKAIGEFVENHPTLKILALSFLIVIGATLIIEGINIHAPKGYIYFAMAFSVIVEMLNLRLRTGAGPAVKLKKMN